MFENEHEKISQPKEISPGIWLHKESQPISQEGANELIIWKIEITTMSIVEFEVDLTNSSNIKLQNSSELKAKVIINPFEIKEIARILIYGKPQIKAKFKLGFNVPDKNFQNQIIKKDIEEIENNMKISQNNLNDISLELESPKEIENYFIQKKIKKFVDFDFPPSDSSFIGITNDQNIKEDLDYIFHWRRPENFVLLKSERNHIINNINNNQEIISSTLINIFNNNEPEPNDIHQEMLPDNNLASALSGIAEKYNLVSRLFKTKGTSKYGIYQIILYVNGCQKIVVIDDLFPCIPMGNPIVTRSPSNEIWVLLLEKAVAKIMEGYYNIINLTLAESLIILTGCPTFSFSMEDLVSLYEDGEFCNKIKNYVIKDKYLVMAINSIDQNEEEDENNNNNNMTLIQSNHGYTVRDIINQQGKIFVNLRKIWFDNDIEKNIMEYQKKLNNIYPNLLNNNNNNMDSSMLMLFEDFKKEFNSLVICYTKSWQEIRLRGSFKLIKEDSKSKYELCLSEDYFYFTIDTPTKVIISLFQDEDKFRGNESRKQIMDISLSILNYYNLTNEITHNQTVDFSHSSNIQIELDLNQGNYIILPRTSGCFIGKPSDNDININLNNNFSTIKMVPLYDYSLKKMNYIFISVIKDIFNKFDKNLNGRLLYDDFKILYYECTNKNLSEDEFKKYLNLYSNFNNGITEKGLIQFFEQEFLQHGDSVIRSWINNLGYDNELFNCKSRNYILTIHSNKNISISRKITFNSNINSKINKILLKNFGVPKINKQVGNIVPIMFQSKLNNVINFGCQNKGNRDANVKVTFINNGELLMNFKNQIEKIIKANSIEFMLQFYIINPDKIDDLNYLIEFSYI